jgi:hypothetical protein
MSTRSSALTNERAASSALFDSAPLPLVLKQISIELESLADAVHVVEEAVSTMSNATTESSKSAVLSLQKIDLVTQSLRAIASFSFRLSQSVPEGWQVDAPAAAEIITISDLAKRLSCSQRRVSWGVAQVVGDWELFD